MKKKEKKLPDFDKMSLAEEAKWWDIHDLGDYWSELKDVDIVFDLNKPRTETLVVRLQKDFKKRLEIIAKNRGLNVSALARMWILEKLQESKSH
mgnify:CR=1 FL=1